MFRMTYGPMQLISIGFGQAALPLDFINQLRRLRERGVVRLVDAAFVAKDEHDGLTTIKVTDIEADEAVFLGMVAGALVGYGALGEKGMDLGAEVGAISSEDGF